MDLCLTLFPWARFRSPKAAVKLHTWLDWRGPMPPRIAISDGQQADVGMLDERSIAPGAFSVRDRGDMDFARLYRLTLAGAFLVTRAKASLQINRLESPPVDKSTRVRSDPVGWLKLSKSIEHYPERFRRISDHAPDTGKALVFLTNNFELPALTIAQLSKCRWRVELFFKWIKQNLRIKHFFGTTDNAVKTPVWIALCVYMLVAILRKELRLELSWSQILQMLSVNVFEQVPLVELVAKTVSQNEDSDYRNQLILNGF